MILLRVGVYDGNAWKWCISVSFEKTPFYVCCTHTFCLLEIECARAVSSSLC